MKLCECGAPIADDSQRCSSCHCRALNRDRVRQQAKGKKAGQKLADHNRAQASGDGYVKEPDGSVTDINTVSLRSESWVEPCCPEKSSTTRTVTKQNNDPNNRVVFESQAEHVRHHKHDPHAHCSCKGVWLGVMPNAAP